MNDDKRKQSGSRREGEKWILSGFQALSKRHLPIFLNCLLGFLTIALWRRRVSKNFSLLLRTTAQTVFGLFDELSISVKGVKEKKSLTHQSLLPYSLAHPTHLPRQEVDLPCVSFPLSSHKGHCVFRVLANFSWICISWMLDCSDISPETQLPCFNFNL